MDSILILWQTRLPIPSCLPVLYFTVVFHRVSSIFHFISFPKTMSLSLAVPLILYQSPLPQP
ncbi:hypothetical protein EDB92DRAFT_1905333, partial [Lactarius akahatsu]